MKLPYGISNFEALRSEGYYYVDKSRYIHTIETSPEKHILLLRPRRFGKTLFVNMMGWYYDLRYADRFDALFKGLWIHHNPTPKRGQYMILSFNFSGIQTQTLQEANEGFMGTVKSRLHTFMKVYPHSFSMEDIAYVMKQEHPSDLINSWCDLLIEKGIQKQVYVLIDEYDHFANNLLSQKKEDFQDLVKTDGYVRPFYEALKKGTETVIDRIFITGVLPILLDSLTSGFNIVKNKSTSQSFHSIMGFSQEEIEPILSALDIPSSQEHMEEIRTYYDGYRFSESQNEPLYNSDMVLYYATEFLSEGCVQRRIDPNVITDYSKIRAVLSIGDAQLERVVLEQVVRDEVIAVREITQQFILTRESGFVLDETTILSLLFYMGYLTIQEKKEESILLRVPNLVMKKMYWEYLYVIQRLAMGKKAERTGVDEMISSLLRGNADPMIEMIESFLKGLSNRDYQRFDEKYIKMTILSLVRDVELYVPQSEYPVESVGYVDLYLRAVFQPERFTSWWIELKYLKASQKEREVEQAFEEGKQQIDKYLAQAEGITHPLLGLVLVFQKDRCVRKAQISAPLPFSRA